MRAARSVNSREPDDGSLVIERKLLGFAQDFGGRVFRLGRAFFRYPLAAGLSVHAGAADEENFRPGETIEQIAQALEIYLTIAIGIAATRAGRMNNSVEFVIPGGNLSCVGKVDCFDPVRLFGQFSGRFRRTSPTFHFPTVSDKQVGSRLPEIAATGNQDARHRLSIFT